jgi:hypothetical protein
MTLSLPIQKPLAGGTFAAAALAAAIAFSPAPAAAGGYNGGDVLAAGVLGAFVGAMVAPPVYGYPVYGAPVYGGPVYGAPIYRAPVYAPVYSPPPVVYVEPPLAYDGPDFVRKPIYGSDRQYRYGGKYLDEGPPAVGQQPGYKHPPKVVTYDETVGGDYAGGTLEPWSKGWFDWCRANFRSFDGRTGTYKGYDGQRHFCEVN